MSTADLQPSELVDRVPMDAAGAREIGFDPPRLYNASRLLFDNLQRNMTDRVALHAPEGSFTYADVCTGACQFGHGLTALGMRRGDRVLLLLDDTPYAVAAFFGAIRAGLVPVLLDPASTAAQIQHVAKASDALVAIVDAVALPQLSAPALAGTRLSAAIVINGEPTGREPLPVVPVFPWLGEFPGTLPAADTDRDDMAFWILAPGLPGQPKIVVHLQHDLGYAAGCHARSVLGLGAADRCLSHSPLFTANGLCATLAYPFSVGASSAVRPQSAGAGRDPATYPLADLHSFKPTVLFGDAGLYAQLAVDATGTAGDPRALQGLRLCLSTSPVAPSLHTAWQQQTGHKIIESLGMPETLCPFISGTADVHKPGTLGRRVPGFELILTDAAGRLVADGEEGMLWVRGHSSAPCYWNQPDMTAETMGAEGWVYTGERLVRDVYGFYARKGGSRT